MSAFSLLETLLNKGRYSALHRQLLNVVLPIVVPFNYRHGYRVLSLDDGVVVRVPRRRSNWNHLKGIHACALATGAEMAAGLSVLSTFSPRAYRIIMAHIECEYHYQARRDCRCIVTALSASEKGAIAQTLTQEEKADIEILVDIRDSQEEHIATVRVRWQLKPWSAVRTQP